MGDRKVVVPKGMLAAAAKASGRRDDLEGHFIYPSLEAALRWLMDHPIVPTMVDAENMRDSGHPCILDGVWYAIEWQRRMFLAPELQVRGHTDMGDVIESYRRGKESK